MNTSLCWSTRLTLWEGVRHAVEPHHVSPGMSVGSGIHFYSQNFLLSNQCVLGTVLTDRWGHSDEQDAVLRVNQ